MNRKLCVVTAALTICVLCGLVPADDEREEKPRFKGVELYSWKDASGDWAFVLLNGTNRLKAEKEVKEAKNRVTGVQELKKALARLAVAEHVSWVHTINGFEYPPEATRREVETAAKAASVELWISGQKE